MLTKTKQQQQQQQQRERERERERERIIDHCIDNINKYLLLHSVA